MRPMPAKGLGCVIGSILVCAGSFGVTAQELVDQANSRDDAWEGGTSGWVACMRSVNDGFAGTAGLVVQLGDSITYASPGHAWIRYGSGRTAEDNEVRSYMHVDAGDATDGVYLARYDVPSGNRSYTAESSIDTAEYLGSPPYGLPNCDAMFVTGAGTDGNYNNFTGGHAAEICVLMLGSNDAQAERSAADFRANMETIAAKIMQNNDTVLVLVTIPPQRGLDTTVQSYNHQIRDLAENGLVVPGLHGGEPVKFPLIDYYQEIVARRPSDWDGTLIGADGVHPSANYGGYNATSDPYASDGAALANSGCLLRCFVYVQKIKEVKEYVIDRTKNPTDAVADAGPDQTVPPGLSVTLDGTGSTGETSRTWSVTMQPPGSSVSLSDPAAEQPTFTPLVIGDYRLQLEVTDGVSSDTDAVVVHVVGAEAEAGGPLDDVIVGTPVGLSGNGSPAPPATYSWTVGTSPPASAATIQDAASSAATFTPDVWGTYVFTLTVDYGTSRATDSVTLVAHSVTADAGPDGAIRPGALVILDGSASLGGSNIQRYSWVELTATGATLTPSATDPAKATFTSGEPGTVYEFRLIVESTDGEISEDTVRLTVSPQSQPTGMACSSASGDYPRLVPPAGGIVAVLLLGRRSARLMVRPDRGCRRARPARSS